MEAAAAGTAVKMKLLTSSRRRIRRRARTLTTTKPPSSPRHEATQTCLELAKPHKFSTHTWAELRALADRTCRRKHKLGRPRPA
eukprot:4288645-Pleurochrysis_carterae.AAC.3